ncbi:MAG TPA: PEP-CTERM sorting domain-containing protein [Stellaceae bacterium]|nr:PEP-CTERM sorting domain-containing protein [Stellaceae bacterium]
MLLIAVGAVGLSAAANATTLTESGAYLRYINQTPSVLLGPGGEKIDFGATDVVPNSLAGTTGVATTKNLNTGAPLSFSIPGIPSPVNLNAFGGDISVCTTSCTPASNNNPANLTGPWTLTFKNPGTSNGSVSTQLSLAGPGFLPFVNSVTLSGTSANPTFSWTPPASTGPSGVPVNGYRIDIYQNGLSSNPNSDLIFATNLGPSATSYTLSAMSLLSNTAYTLGIVAIQTRNGSNTNLGNANDRAVSFAYSSFQTLPIGAPPVVLPVTTVSGAGVVFGFNLTVAPGITYHIDPAVATGYIYRTGAGNPNFASVELPDIGNLSPYDLYLWNGSTFVFDTTLAAKTPFDFATGGVSEFEVLRIDPNLGLDPLNTTAFITALTFEGAGNFTGTMTPVTEDISSAPEPASLALLSCGLLGFGIIRRQRRFRRGPRAFVATAR